MARGYNSLADARHKVGHDLFEFVVNERLVDVEKADQEDRRAFESEGVRLVPIALEQGADFRVARLRMVLEPDHLHARGLEDRGRIGQSL